MECAIIIVKEAIIMTKEKIIEFIEQEKEKAHDIYVIAALNSLKAKIIKEKEE